MTFYTPTYKRPSLLEQCQASVKGQSCTDWQHLIVRDEVGIGIAGMFAEIPNHLDEIDGRYVYVLQDDDRLVGPDVLGELKTFALASKAGDKHKHPPVIMVKNRKRGMTLPLLWGKSPVLGGVDLGSYAVRADVFRKHAGQFGKRYEGDYDFIAHLWERYDFAWCEVLFAEAQALGLGRTETALREQGELV